MHNNAIITANRVIYQEEIFPDLTDRFGYLTNNHEKLIQILDLIDLNKIYPRTMWDSFFGRPPMHRHVFIRAFIARIIWNIGTTKSLVAYLKVDRALRAICGLDHRSNKVPSESAFSREFAELSKRNIADKIHEYLIAEHCAEQLYEYGSIDSSAIPVAEKAVRTKKPVTPIKKEMPVATTTARTENEVATTNQPPVSLAGEPEEPTIKIISQVVAEAVAAAIPKLIDVATKDKKYTTQDQLTQGNQEILSLLPVHCNFGSKKDSKGFKSTWKGYKLHVIVNEFGIPMVSLVTSASVNDMMCAIPLIRETEERADVLYYLGDKGYDAAAIRAEIEKFDKAGIIDFNHRGNGQDLREFSLQEKSRYGKRSLVEGCFSTTKMQYLPAYILFRGIKKVKCLLNLVLSVITASQIIKFA